jgi:hypothetical protein
MIANSLGIEKCQAGSVQRQESSSDYDIQIFGSGT